MGFGTYHFAWDWERYRGQLPLWSGPLIELATFLFCLFLMFPMICFFLNFIFPCNYTHTNAFPKNQIWYKQQGCSIYLIVIPHQDLRQMDLILCLCSSLVWSYNVFWGCHYTRMTLETLCWENWECLFGVGAGPKRLRPPIPLGICISLGVLVIEDATQN